MTIVKITIFFWALFIIARIFRIPVLTPEQRIMLHLGNYEGIGWNFWLISILSLLTFIGTIWSVIYLLFLR